MFWLGSVELPFDFVALWERERGAHGLKHEWLALKMGISSQQLSQQLHGHGHPSFKRVLLLLSDPDGRAFVEGLVNRIFVHMGMAEVAPFLDWLKEGQAIATRSRMAKASLAPQHEERKIA